MMGKTHLAMGIATALLVLHPITPAKCVVAVIGGALGGVAADIDIVKHDYKHDALIGQLLSIGVTAIALLLDFLFRLGTCEYLISEWNLLHLIGLISYIVLIGIGFSSAHRTFTHSLLSMILFSTAVLMLCPSVVIAYLLGYTSHLLLDILNKKPVPLLYPKGKGICLKWFYADKDANMAFMWIGVIASLLLIINSTAYRFF